MAGLSDEDVGLAAARPAGLSDEDVGLAAPARGPIASQFGGAPGMPEGVDVPGAMAPDAAPPPEAPANAFAPPESVMPAPASIADRFKINAREGFDNTMAGEVINRSQSGQVAQTAADDMFRAIVEARQAGSPVGLDVYTPTAEDKASKFPGLHQPQPNPYAGVPLSRLEADFNKASQEAAAKAETFGAKREAQAAETAALPSFTEAPTLKDKAIQGAVALAGEMAGGFASPENLIGGPGKGAAVRVGEGLLARAAREAAPGVIAGAAGSAVAAPAVAASKAERGEGEGLTGAGLGESVALGAAVGGAFHLPGIIARPLLEAIGRRRGVAVDHVDPATVGPAEIQEAFKDPQIAALAKANGIESPTDARVPVLEDKLAARKGEEALRTPDQPGGPLKAQDAEIARRQAEKAGVEDGTIDRAATNLTTRTPNETPIAVDREGNAFRSDAGALEGRAKAGDLQRADTKLLPAPGRAVPTDEEIALQRASSERGSPPDAETPPKLYGSEGRAPQTSEGVETQRQAGEAFDLAQRQRDRAGADVRDTQTAGRPEGANPQTIHLDEGHPVEIVNRRMVPDAKGNMVDVATVRRYDPRTGKPADDHVEYDVPAKQLKTGQYAQEPRMAQDFEARAGTPEGEKMGLPRQTYRTTPPDDNAAGTARAARPEQPAGDHPGPRFSKAEEASGEANGPAGDQYAKQKTSTKAAKPDRDGRFTVDENGYVKSDKEGPVRFADQKQAAKWIINEGHKKSLDQVFEIANHPAGKGFTVRERGRTETPPPPEGGGREEPPRANGDTSAPRQLNGSRDAAPPSGDGVRGEASYDEQVKAERDRLWSEEMKGYSRDGKTNEDGTAAQAVGNHRMVDQAARETVMRREAAEQVAGAEREGLDDRGAHELAQLYRRADGETPQQAWDRAVDRWTEKTEAEAIAHENGMGAEDQTHDMLDRGGETLYTDNHDAIHGPEVDHEAIPFEHDTAGEPHGGDRGATAREGAERSGDTEARGQAGRRSEDASRNTDAGPDGKRQTVIPGAERLTDRELAERQGSKPLKGGDEPPPKGGLFDEDARNQNDMFDQKTAERATDNGRHYQQMAKTLNDRAKAYDGRATEASAQARQEIAKRGKLGTLAKTLLAQAEDFRQRAKDTRAERDQYLQRVGKGGEDFFPGSTFHANPLFDPAVWKWFGSKIAGDKYLREMSALAKDFKEDKADTRGRKTNKAADAARFVFYSVDGQMRALADAIKSPTVKKIADLFFTPADAGRGGALDPGYHEAVTTRSGRNLNKLSEIMEKLGDKPGAMDQVVKLVQNPRNIKPGTVVHDTAAAITKLLAEEHSYLKAAGIDVGKVVGYYPREINVASVMKNGDAFRLAAERAYKASGLGAQEAKEAAEQWLSRVVLGGVNIRPEGTDFVHLGGTPASKFSKGRELSKAADEIMAPFYHRDPLEALTTYFQRTARRAEWARRMGDYVKGPDGKPAFDELGAWKKMKAEMIAEGNAAAVRQVVGMVSSSVGANSATLPHGADALIGILKAYGTIKLLTHAAITSASESVLPAIRAGAPHRILTDMPRTVAALFAKSGKLGEQRAFAEDLGLVMRGAANGILAARYSAIDPASRVRERIMNRNFRMSGLEQWTSATRVMAVNGAEAFIRRLGLDVADSKLRQASSRNLLKELGVQDTAGFAKWVKENEGNLKGRDVTTGGFSTVYRNAVVRFVHQSIMEVSASTRPQWANHPVGSLIFMLQSYNMAYQKNVTARAGHQIMSAVTGKGMNLADRATMLSPLALIPAMFAIQMGLAPVRNAVFNSAHQKQKSDEDQLTNNMIQAASRSVTGAFDPLVQIFTSAKYHSSSENILGGPVAAGVGQLADAVVALTPKEVGGPNSPKTNAAERNVTRNIYDSVIAPAIVTAGALSPSWLGAILTQAPSLAPVKDAVIDSVAGAPTKQGASGRPQRPSRK